jgi:hypothetical protein
MALETRLDFTCRLVWMDRICNKVEYKENEKVTFLLVNSALFTIFAGVLKQI